MVQADVAAPPMRTGAVDVDRRQARARHPRRQPVEIQPEDLARPALGPIGNPLTRLEAEPLVERPRQRPRMGLAERHHIDDTRRPHPPPERVGEHGPTLPTRPLDRRTHQPPDRVPGTAVVRGRRAASPGGRLFAREPPPGTSVAEDRGGVVECQSRWRARRGRSSTNSVYQSMPGWSSRRASTAS